MSEANLPVPKRRIRRRWWIAATILLFIAVFPTIEGPASYAYTRGWLPGGLYQAICRPLSVTIGVTGVSGNLRLDYRRWWKQLAMDHRGYSSSVILPRNINGVPVRFHYFCFPDRVSNGLSDGSVVNREERYLWIEVEKGRRFIIEENRILWNGEVIAKIPKTTKLIEIKFIEGESEVEINGDSIPLGQ